MAYNTQFNLTWEGEDPTLSQLTAKLAALADNVTPEDPRYPVTATIWKDILTGNDETSWGDYESHMTIISNTWPQVLFQLEGHGDDRDDNWRTYYLDGRSETLLGHTVYPEIGLFALEAPRPSVTTGMTLEHLLQSFETEVDALRPPRPKNTEHAKRVLRTIYGHAPQELSIKAAGHSIILITATSDNSNRMDLLLPSDSPPVSYTTIHGQTTTKKYMNPAEVPDEHLLRDLEAIRKAHAASS